MQSKAAQQATSLNHNFDVRKTRLKNGLVVISEKMRHVRSVSFGIFLRSGSRHERADQHGLTHFIEHALFKGTHRRSVTQIAAETDVLGGNLDAFTGREMVGFYNKVLDEHLPRAFDLIADLVTGPSFDPGELKKERNVILEEIKMVEDTPDDIIFDLFCAKFYPRHPLGRTILGTQKSLKTFTGAAVQSYYDDIYRPDNFVIAAAGHLEHDGLVDLARQYFNRLQPRRAHLTASTPQAAASITLRNKPELEQSHLVIGVPCPSLVSEDRYVANLLSVILGGGASSRLFQAVREERGLAYTVYAALNPFQDCGYLTIYAATSTAQLEATINATMAELRRLKGEPISPAELQRNKDQLKASVLLNLDSPTSRMSALVAQETSFGRFFAPDQIIRRIEAVTAADVQRLAQEIFRPRLLAAIVVGALDGFQLKRAQLQC